ncbi:hypothetical protein NMO_1562 [Neisseria meningitidis alpha14]|uniref:Uncharacterized protein n=1 Tax=Neisseria meningitidis (strain alpha14) TaxID=662598 RepID=C6S8I4_NEIML|nr:hypothetical protein NMO_1562 [Neisseria meningitidis alpha14]
MYYQVGNKCLEKHQAENLYFSLVVPRIKENGQIVRPEYNGSLWKMSDGQPLRLLLAECSPKTCVWVSAVGRERNFAKVSGCVLIRCWCRRIA